jgi:ribose/xylose/arabinose/galactoside ABC-type transport system permease subunit
VDRSSRRAFQGTQRRILVFEVLLAASLLLCWRLASSAELSVNDWQGFLLALTPLAIASMAQTFPIIAGGQGLSAGATLFLVTGVVATWPIIGEFDALIAILLGLALGSLIGALNGLLIGFFGLRSTVVTLAVGAISTALALQHFSAAYAAPPEALQKILLGMQVAGISIWPVSAIVGICLVGAAILQTRFGRAIRLIGTGAGLTQRPRLLFWAYVFAGLGAAIGGVFLAAEVGSVDAAAGAPFLLEILAAAALGGSAPGLRGGTILGSLIGALIVVSVGNLFVPFRIPDFLSSSIDGAWLLIGFSLCVIATRARSLKLAPKNYMGAEARSLIANLSLVSPIALLAFNYLRPAASDLSTLASGIAMLAVGQAAVLRIGAIDLSMPGLISFSSTATVALTQYSDVRLPYVMFGLLMVAICVGSTHMWLGKRLGRATIAATLATSGLAQTAVAGLLVLLPAGYAPPELMALATTRWFGLSPLAWLMTAAALAMAALLGAKGDQSLGFVASAIASVTFGVVVAALGGSVHFSLIDTNTMPAVAAALLASRGFGQPFASLSLAIPIAYGVVFVDAVLLSENVDYAGRVLGLALAMLCGEGLRVAFNEKRVRAVRFACAVVQRQSSS